VKNDYLDCRELIDRMRLHKLPEAWIAPPELRELRELVRYRAKLVCIRTGLKAQVKAVLAKHCLHPPVKDLWGVVGPRWLDEITLPDGYRARVDSLRRLVAAFARTTGPSLCTAPLSSSAVVQSSPAGHDPQIQLADGRR
jgi:hypothetical protein